MSMAHPERPSYAFAARHGATLMGVENGAAVIAHRPGVAIAPLVNSR